MMPVNLAEHHVPRKDHHLGRGAPFVGDCQSIACLVEAERANQPLLVKVAAIRNARVQAVANQLVHFVDIDRPAEHAL